LLVPVAGDVGSRAGSVAVRFRGEAASLTSARVALLAVADPDPPLPLLDAAALVASRAAGVAEHQRAGVFPCAVGVRVLPGRVRRQIAGAVAVVVDRPGVVLRVAHPQRLRAVRTGHLVPFGTAARAPGSSGRAARFATSRRHTPSGGKPSKVPAAISRTQGRPNGHNDGHRADRRASGRPDGHRAVPTGGGAPQVRSSRPLRTASDTAAARLSTLSLR
jgi:hypothetical protein